MLTIFALILALIPPPGSASGQAASPGPSTSPRALKTIVTVKSSPYCNALADHFNGALVPMAANDRVFEVVDVQLDDMNVMFNYPDYVNRFVDLRNKLVKESGNLEDSLKPIQAQIAQLRQSAALSTDPAAAKDMTDAASQLQDAYNHQFQLSTDLWNMARQMMEYNPMRHPQPLGGWTPYQNTVPEDEKNIKVFLHFDKQITSIDTSEDHAVDIATNAAETHCASSSPQPK